MNPVTRNPFNSQQLHWYWDVASPYCYLAFVQWQRMDPKRQAQCLFHPVHLKTLLLQSNNTLPAACLNKSRYIPDDLEYWRDHYRVAMKIPFVELKFPIDTTLAMYGALLAAEQQVLIDYMRMIFRAYWVDGLRLDKPEILIDTIQQRLIEHSSLQDQKTTLIHHLLRPLCDDNAHETAQQQLVQHTQQLVDQGGFGLPSFMVGEQLFFGNDRLDLALAKLATPLSSRQSSGESITC